MVVDPPVAVVVPTRNRHGLLSRLIAHLEQQRGVDGFEVIVVDDSSTDRTPRVLEELAGSSPLEIRVARTASPSGPAAARNIGWRLTRAPLIAFTDDDCRPEPGWLAGLLASIDGADIVQGRTAVDPDEERGRGPFTQIVWVDGWSAQFETSNVAYRRTVLERLGGFDESFGADSYGEDVDLGWRAIESGARTVFTGDAVVVHDVKRGATWPDLRARVRDARRWRHLGRLLRDHPGYRQHRLARDPFLFATHPPTLLALAGSVALVLGRGRPGSIVAALALAAPWVRHRTLVEPRPGGRRRAVAALPGAFAIDAVETITVVASGVRYRTFVL